MCAHITSYITSYITSLVITSLHAHITSLMCTQVPIILLQRMDLLLKKTSQEDVKKHVIPMILRAMEGGGATSNIQLQVSNNEVYLQGGARGVANGEPSPPQELCVSILPTFAGVMDYSSLKHSIVPRLVTTCSAETTSLGVSTTFPLPLLH